MERPTFEFCLNDPFTQKSFERLKRHPKRIVFPEGEDLRILYVAEKLAQMEVAVPMLLGNKERIRKMAEEFNIDLSFVGLIDPATSSDLDLFCERLKRIEKYKGMYLENAHEMISNPIRFASMMVQYGQADGFVGGNKSKPATVFRALQQLVKPDPNVPNVFAATMLLAPHLNHFGRDGYMLLADTAINPSPNIQELAAIALSSGDLAARLLEVRPRVAMLSHSTKGSNLTKEAQNVAAASALAHETALRNRQDIVIDGEIQADVAINPKAAEKKAPHMDQKGPVDVLVFPNLDAAHISSKLLQHTSNVMAFGQFVLGLDRPAAQVPITACADSILGTTVAVAIEAITVNEQALDKILPVC